MIAALDLHRLGVALIVFPEASEADLRRGISTLYYGVFHRLISDGSSIFQNGGAALTSQAGRAFSHSVMRQVCEAYVRSPKRPFAPPLDHLAPTPPDRRIIQISEAFIQLQEGRQIADYDLIAAIERTDALELLEQAEFVHWALDELLGLPDVTVFLAALLLADRWKRRG